jgi:hypothetical protein
MERSAEEQVVTPPQCQAAPQKTFAPAGWSQTPWFGFRAPRLSQLPKGSLSPCWAALPGRHDTPKAVIAQVNFDSESARRDPEPGCHVLPTSPNWVESALTGTNVSCVT